ncbi:hypothetical protein BDW74DRAFT_31541 [Aspergillus multicolor]|uniref:uncharacterized protein n=1 Tax=Aspergillus multicolor TaxID=41759 RepID=UPI003CCD95ED
MQQATVQRWYNVLKSLPNCQYFHFYKDRKAATEDNKVTEPLTLGDAITIFLTFCVQLERPIKGSHILNLGTYSADEALEVPDLRGLSMAPVQLPGFKKTLSTVEDMTIGHKSVTASSVPSVDFDFSLLWHALQLKELRINFEAGNGGADMIARLAATAPDHPFSLEILYIEDTLGIRGQDLQAILSRHRSTLQKLIFCFVTMNEGDWEDTLLFMAENTFPQLQGVTFFHISEGSPADAYFLEFPGLEGSAALVDKETGSSIIGKGAGVWDGPHRPVHAEYHGPKVNVADRKLASAAAIFSPYLDDL